MRARHSPNSWLWDFGDLTTSTDQDPLHTYTTPGTYTVTLTASNGNGNDTEIQTGLIQYLEGFLCDTSSIPDNGQLVLDECQGLLVDDGGITDNVFPRRERFEGDPRTSWCGNGDAAVRSVRLRDQFRFPGAL